MEGSDQQWCWVKCHRMKCSSMRVVEKSTIMNVTTWVSLIMRCVQTLSFSILVNGFPRDVFCPYRGLKQCDHLSPYLFILCVVVLSTLIIKADEQGSLHGLRICPYAFFYFTLVFLQMTTLFSPEQQKGKPQFCSTFWKNMKISWDKNVEANAFGVLVMIMMIWCKWCKWAFQVYIQDNDSRIQATTSRWSLVF